LSEPMCIYKLNKSRLCFQPWNSCHYWRNR